MLYIPFFLEICPENFRVRSPENLKFACENQQSAYAKTKTQIICAVIAQLISVFVFATQIVHPFLKSEISSFQPASETTGPLVSDLVGNSNCLFSHAAAHFV